MDTNEEKIRKIIMEQLQVDADEVTPGSSFKDDLGADSLDVVELCMEIEEVFGFDIPSADADKMSVVQDLYDYIDERTAK
jgi:acyl carrier protein